MMETREITVTIHREPEKRDDLLATLLIVVLAALALVGPALGRESASVHDGWDVDLSDEGCSMERDFANGDRVGMYMAPGEEALFFNSKRLTGVRPGESIELTLRSAGREQIARATVTAG